MDECKKKEASVDEELLALYWARDEEAIRRTEEVYGRLLFRIAYNILHSRPDCEECRNDTYLAAWNAIPPERPAVLPAFLVRIMRNLATKRYRERAAQKRIPSELTVSLEELDGILQDGGVPEAEYDAALLGRLISDYIRTLPRRRQYLFIGRFYLSETLEQLAGELGVGVSTVHRELAKLKQGLRAHLERNGVYV